MTFRLATPAFLAAALLAGAAFAQPAPARTASLELSFHGFEQTRGTVLAAVFDSEAAYAGGRPVRAVMLPVAGARAATRIEGLAPGRYAVRAFHDLDGDGDMDTNPFGMPTEPYAFSNDAQGNMGPAQFADAAFTVAGPSAAHAIRIR